MTTLAEENYLKAIYKHALIDNKGVSTNTLAEELKTKAASVTDMLRKLSEKELINYKKYQGVTLTSRGKKVAINIIRKHRLWEVFLVEKLKFKWDEVHDIAEQLEHINSKELIERLDNYLGYPKFDPHGDPIPDKTGNIKEHKENTLDKLNEGEEGNILGVKEHAAAFLQYLESVKLVLGTKIKVVKHFDYDNSKIIKVNGTQELTISEMVSKNLYIRSNEEI
ncbi:MAG: metal-dependent transcriptional regulator [Bacteroidia bacterium]